MTMANYPSGIEVLVIVTKIFVLTDHLDGVSGGGALGDLDLGGPQLWTRGCGQ
jgi:hypothetical protein